MEIPLGGIYISTRIWWASGLHGNQTQLDQNYGTVLIHDDVLIRTRWFYSTWVSFDKENFWSHQNGVKHFWTVGLLDVQVSQPIKVSFSLKVCMFTKHFLCNPKICIDQHNSKAVHSKLHNIMHVAIKSACGVKEFGSVSWIRDKRELEEDIT